MLSLFCGFQLRAKLRIARQCYIKEFSIAGTRSLRTSWLAFL
jgi:hypothetical protein